MKGELIFYDIHDNDYKKIYINNNKIKIFPYKNREKWEVNCKLNSNNSCLVNFNVKGKSNPPPIPIEMVFSQIIYNENISLAIVFFDPTGKLQKKNIPLNIWYNVN
tara:strand:+ start:89 stop:406 length:318 start_codon:yes stop_codon:yes gene_type:complete